MPEKYTLTRDFVTINPALIFISVDLSVSLPVCFSKIVHDGIVKRATKKTAEKKRVT